MFIEQAYKGKNDLWRVIVTTLVSTGIFIANFIGYLLISDEEMDKTYELMKSLPKWLSLTVNLIPFVFLLGLLFLLVRFIHERSILSLSTSRKSFDFKRFGFSLGLIVFITLFTFGISYYYDNSMIQWNFNPIKFAVLLIISLLLFPFQIGLEEYLFRGYLMQQIGIMARNRWTPLIITSVVFGIMHSANPEVAEMGYGVMIFYIGTGFLLGVMTLMDEGMELALGFHLGNNLMAALLITSDFSALQTDAVFKYTSDTNPSNALTEMILSMAIMYPLILFIFAKKYKWKDWKDKLTGKVNEPETAANNKIYEL
jgi:uncharacterized protein